MQALQFFVHCGTLKLLTLSAKGIYMLFNGDKEARLHELYHPEMCSAVGLALGISNVQLMDTV